MVLRLVVLISILASTLAQAQSLKSLYQQKKYSEYVRAYQNKYQDYRRAPGAETLYYAQSLAKTKKYQRSNKMFSYILKRYYRKDLIAFRKKSDEEFNDNFVAILHTMARNHLDSYRSHPDAKSRQAQGFEKAYLHYYESLEDIDQVDDDAITIMAEDYEDYKEDLKQRIFKWRYYAEAGYYSYQTAPRLVQNSTGQETPLLANSGGIALGGGARYENSKRAYFGAIYLVSGSATVESQDTNITYLQEGAGAGLNIFEAGHLFKFADGKAEVGGSIFAILSAGDFAEPPGFTIEDKDIFSFGYSIDSYYNFSDHWAMSLRMGNAFSFESATWFVGARYIF